MSRPFSVTQLPTPLKEPETQLQFLITWDCTRSVPLDADTIIREALEDALHRLENSRATRKAARQERRV